MRIDRSIREKLDNNNHSVFSLNYHLILVIKYRRKVITDESSNFLKEVFLRICPDYKIGLKEWGHDKDHVHILFKAQPDTSLSRFIKALHRVWLRIGFLKSDSSCGKRIFGQKVIV